MKSDQELYRRLRALTPDQLWRDEVPRFNKASPAERIKGVSVIRAVGVAFAGTGGAEQKAEVRSWLMRLLNDPAEKIRRYALAALPKIGAGAAAEHSLITLLKSTPSAREKVSAGRALDKIGGPATLEALQGTPDLPPQTEQKVKARVLRNEQPSTLHMDRSIAQYQRLRIHLRGRRGLENLVREEVEETLVKSGRFRLLDTQRGCVALSPLAPFRLSDLYRLRCFGTVGLVLDLVPHTDAIRSAGKLAAAITSPRARYLFTTLTEGTPRYRLEFAGKGHQRGAVHLIANRAFALCPDILNDPRQAIWSVDLHETSHGISVELRPRLSPDPRLYYRTDDVDAASHPPLAAAMARLADVTREDVVWDPFCGSGLELVECALRGGARQLIGTDISPEALAIAEANLKASGLKTPATFAPCDFREAARLPELATARVTLIITNPPLGRRIRLPDPTAFFTEFFAVASRALQPGGRLVFINPIRVEPRDPALVLESRQVVDLGGYDGRLEVWRKSAVARPVAPAPRPGAPTPAPAPRRKPQAATPPWYSAVAKRKKTR
jgi:predicted RNA methylase